MPRRYSNRPQRSCCICVRRPPLRGGGCCILAKYSNPPPKGGVAIRRVGVAISQQLLRAATNTPGLLHGAKYSNIPCHTFRGHWTREEPQGSSTQWPLEGRKFGLMRENTHERSRHCCLHSQVTYYANDTHVRAHAYAGSSDSTVYTCANFDLRLANALARGVTVTRLA